MAATCWWEHLEVAGCYLSCAAGGRADAKRSFYSTVIFSQTKPTAEGRFHSLYRCTEACWKQGEDGEGEAVKQSSQHSAAQNCSHQHGQRWLSGPWTCQAAHCLTPPVTLQCSNPVHVLYHLYLPLATGSS